MLGSNFIPFSRVTFDIFWGNIYLWYLFIYFEAKYICGNFHLRFPKAQLEEFHGKLTQINCTTIFAAFVGLCNASVYLWSAWDSPEWLREGHVCKSLYTAEPEYLFLMFVQPTLLSIFLWAYFCCSLITLYPDLHVSPHSMSSEHTDRFAKIFVWTISYLVKIFSFMYNILSCQNILCV